MKNKAGMRVIYGAFLWTFHVLAVDVQEERWSQVYKTLYSSEQQVLNRSLKVLSFKKENTFPCTQFIVGWNVLCPENSYFDVYLRAHTQGADKTNWQEWHKLASWGDGIQKTYFSRGAQSTFNYVRFEMNEGLYADGFEVKIVPHNVPLDAVYALFVCATDFKKFKPERPYIAGRNKDSVLVQGVAKKSQKMIDHPRIGALCSPTTVSMLLEFLWGRFIDPLETARGVYDEGLDVFGNWSFNMAYAFEKALGSYYFYTARLHSFDQLHAILMQGMPVAVSVRGRIKGARKIYPNGHLLLVIGFDAKKQQVLCHDPAFDSHDQVYVAYDIAEFIPAWERSFRLAYRCLGVS